MNNRRRWHVLGAILALSLLLRATTYFYFLDTAFPWFPTDATESDMHATWEWSDRILAGDILGRDTYHPEFQWMKEAGSRADWAQWWGNPKIFQQEPLYTYWIAALRWLLPSPLHTIPLLQLLLGGTLLPLAIFLFGREIAGTRTSLYAAALAAIFGPEIFYQTALLRDWTVPIGSAFALAFALRAIRRSRPSLLFAAGVLLGFGALLKSSALLWLPVWLGWWWFATMRPVPSACRLKGFATLLLGFALGLSPVVIRNAIVGASFLALSNRLPEGLIIGNAADSVPIGVCMPASLPATLKAASSSPIKVLGEIFRGYRAAPGSFSRVQGMKLLAAFSPYDYTDNLSYSYGQQRMFPLRFCPSWGTLLSLALPGLLLLLTRRGDNTLWIVGIVAVNTAAILLPNALGRYRLEILPLLALGAAQTLRLALVHVRFHRWNRLALCVGAVGTVALLTQLLAGPAQFQPPAGPDALPWAKLQRVQLPNRIVAMRIFSAQHRFLAAADEAADLSIIAGRFPATISYVSQARCSEIRFLVLAALAASQSGDMPLVAEMIERARLRLAATPPAEKLSRAEWGLFLAEKMPSAIAEKFAEILQPNS